MKVFETTFPGFYITGYAVVVAPNKTRAIELLKKELMTIEQNGNGDRKLFDEEPEINPDHVREIDITKSNVSILSDGDY